MQAWRNGSALTATRVEYTALLKAESSRPTLMNTSKAIRGPQQAVNSTTTRISILITCTSVIGIRQHARLRSIPGCLYPSAEPWSVGNPFVFNTVSNFKIGCYLRHQTNDFKRVAVISAKSHKRQRRKRPSVTAKREKSQTPKVLTAILTMPNLT